MFQCADVSSAAVRDTDFDGLTDEGERSIYQTNPEAYDTDGDTVGDGQEIVSETDPLDSNDSVLARLSRQDSGIFGPQTEQPWYLARASGLLAFMLLTFGSVYGLVMSSRAFNRIIASPTAYELHRVLSFASLGAVLLHIGSFFFDDYVQIRFFEALIPGVLKRDFPSALGYDLGFSVGLGIVAFYLMIILIVTSEFRAKLHTKTWRRIHYVSFVAYLLFVVHGFTAGTDSGQLWVRWMYIGSLSLVSMLVLVRIFSRVILPRWQARNQHHDVDTGIHGSTESSLIS